LPVDRINSCRYSTPCGSMSGLPYLPCFPPSPLWASLSQPEETQTDKLQKTVDSQRQEIERLKKEVLDSTSSLQTVIALKNRQIEELQAMMEEILTEKEDDWTTRVKFSSLSLLRDNDKVELDARSFMIGDIEKIRLRRMETDSEHFLTVFLDAKCGSRRDWSIDIIDSYSLVSFKNLDETHDVESEEVVHYDESKKSYGMDLIEMEQLFTDDRQFVRDDSILLEIRLRSFENAVVATNLSLYITYLYITNSPSLCILT
ncbi:hypothetical protein PFISCL1PPCAC_20296, partial [Pristionchus fissidentatus]